MNDRLDVVAVANLAYQPQLEPALEYAGAKRPMRDFLGRWKWGQRLCECGTVVEPRRTETTVPGAW